MRGEILDTCECRWRDLKYELVKFGIFIREESLQL